MDNIKAGIDIYRYAFRLAQLSAELEDVVNKCTELYDLFKDSNDCYKGKASEEIILFFYSLSERLSALSSFYYKAFQFAFKYIEEMKLTDEEIAKVMIGAFGMNS